MFHFPGKNVKQKLAIFHLKLWLKTNIVFHNYVPIRNKLWHLHFIKYIFYVIVELLDELYYFCIMIIAKNASI